MQVRQSVTYSIIDSKSLHDWIVKAIAQAQITGSPILFSYSQNWECINPLLLLASKSEAQQQKFYWEQPNADLVLAAAGSVAEVSVPNHDLSDRFDCAKKFIKHHLTNAIIAKITDLESSELQIPIHFFGAFSFYRNGSNASDYLGLAEPSDYQPAIEFPTLLFFVPRWMVRLKDKSCTLTLNHYIQPWDKPDEVLERIENLRSHLQESSH